jgi:hypothetical protein
MSVSQLLFGLGMFIGALIFIAVLANSEPNWQPLYDELKRKFQEEENEGSND